MFSQTVTNTSNEVFTTVEIMPEYPGGKDEMVKFLSKNIKYPRKEKRKNIQGTVYIKFFIDEYGDVQSIEIIRGIKDGGNLDKEALRVIKKMPKWKPGTQNGKPVKVWYSLPIKFTLRQ